MDNVPPAITVPAVFAGRRAGVGLLAIWAALTLPNHLPPGHAREPVGPKTRWLFGCHRRARWSGFGTRPRAQHPVPSGVTARIQGSFPPKRGAAPLSRGRPRL